MSWALFSLAAVMAVCGTNVRIQGTGVTGTRGTVAVLLGFYALVAALAWAGAWVHVQ